MNNRYLTQDDLPPICEGCGHLMDQIDWSREANQPCKFWACAACKTYEGLGEAIAAVRAAQEDEQ